MPVPAFRCGVLDNNPGLFSLHTEAFLVFPGPNGAASVISARGFSRNGLGIQFLHACGSVGFTHVQLEGPSMLHADTQATVRKMEPGALHGVLLVACSVDVLLVQTVFRPSPTVSRDGLMESCTCHRCHGGPPPHHHHPLTWHCTVT